MYNFGNCPALPPFFLVPGSSLFSRLARITQSFSSVDRVSHDSVNEGEDVDSNQQILYYFPERNILIWKPSLNFQCQEKGSPINCERIYSRKKFFPMHRNWYRQKLGVFSLFFGICRLLRSSAKNCDVVPFSS